MHLKQIVFASLLALSAAVLSAADVAIYETGYERLQEALAELDTLIFPTQKKQASATPELFAQPPHPLNSLGFEAIDKAAQDAVSALRMPEGLDFHAGYTHSRAVGGNLFADLDQEWSYRNRFQLGISWDLQRYGALQASRKRAQIYDRADLDKMRLAAQLKSTALQQALNSTSEKFDSYFLSILNKRIYIHDVLLYLYEALYRTGDVPIDKLFDVSYNKRNLEELQKSFSHAAASESLFSEDAFVFFHVDESRYQMLVGKNEAVAIAAKECEVERSRAERLSYWDEVKLSPFARYQYLDYAAARADVSNAQLGVNLTLPLYNRAKHERRASGNRQALLEERLRQEEAQLQKRGGDYLAAYRRTEQELKGLLWELQRYENEFRMWSYKQNAERIATNGIRAIELIDSYLEALHRYYTARIAYERQLQQLKHLAADEDFSSFVSFERIDRKSAIITKPLAAYLWSKQHGAAEGWGNLVFFANAYCIERLYISYNQNFTKNHYRNLIALVARNRIEPYLCLSRIGLLRESPEKIAAYLQGFNNLPELKGIHLDVEPPQPTEAYLKAYIDMLAVVKKYADRHALALTVALPATYPLPFYEEVSPYVAGATLMIYNRANPDDAAAAMQRVAAAFEPETKLEIAIRPEDYIPDYISVISRLQRNERVSSVALESLATLDETIQRKPVIEEEEGAFALSFFERGKTKRTTVSNFRSYKDAVRYFGSTVKEK